MDEQVARFGKELADGTASPCIKISGEIDANAVLLIDARADTLLSMSTIIGSLGFSQCVQVGLLSEPDSHDITSSRILAVYKRGNIELVKFRNWQSGQSSAKLAEQLLVLTSMREMILYDADLVTKKVRRKHPMEYDFKRRPSTVGMIDVALPKGHAAAHVAFSTRPYETAEEFRLTRDIWDNYRRGQDFCIKSESDFLQFAEAIDRTRSLTENKKAYLRAGDRDGLQRFRRDLCDAFKNGKAGLEFHRHLPNHRFAELLNDVAGFKDSPAIVKVEHVENGKRRKFEPNATVPTRQVLAAMEKLKAVFPRLRAIEFLGAIPEGAAIWSEIATTDLGQAPPSF